MHSPQYFRQVQPNLGMETACFDEGLSWLLFGRTEGVIKEGKGARMLHKELPGTVCVQWVTCGHQNCRCARGQLHGPYFYRFWRQHGRVRKTYVKRSEVESVRKQCAYRRQLRARLRNAVSDWRVLRDVVQEVEKDVLSSCADNG